MTHTPWGHVDEDRPCPNLGANEARDPRTREHEDLMATKYYVEGEAWSKGHRMSADLSGDDLIGVAFVFASQHSDVQTIRVWSDFNASTETARRLPSPAVPLATFHVNRGMGGDEGPFRLHRVEDPA